MKWLKLAAESGDRDGMFVLAIHYLRGDGVPKDRAEFDRWLGEAARLGQPKAIELLHNAEGAR